MRIFVTASFLALCSPAYGATAAFSDAQLCQAAIAVNNGHSAQAVKITSSKGGKVEVSYLRPSDAKHFRFWCQIEPAEIRWKDEYIGHWSENMRDYYRVLDDGSLEVRSVIVGEEQYPDVKTFTHKDF